MNRVARIGLGVLLALLIVVGVGVGFTLLVGDRPDIGNPDRATVEQTLPGTWNLQATAATDFIAGLIDEFDEAELRTEMTALHIGDPVRIELTIGDGTIAASSNAAGTSYQLGDGTYRIIDNHTLLVTRGDCEVRAQFRLSGDLLTFGIISPCPTQLSDLTLAVLLRGAPFNRAATP
jgi:hypothetical protein